MLLLERQRKSIDDAAQDLKKLGDSVVVLRLVNESAESSYNFSYIKKEINIEISDALVKDVVDLLPDVRAEPEKLAVYPVQGRLEKIPLTGIF